MCAMLVLVTRISSIILSLQVRVRSTCHTFSLNTGGVNSNHYTYSLNTGEVIPPITLTPSTQVESYHLSHLLPQYRWSHTTYHTYYRNTGGVIPPITLTPSIQVESYHLSHLLPQYRWYHIQSPHLLPQYR